MIRSLLSLGLVVMITVVLLFSWWRSIAAHRKRLDRLDLKIHVNGIRGKSSVTRLLAGVLREGGYLTVGKTTGSAARVILPDGQEEPIKRSGAPTINEQLQIVATYADRGVEALVIECMAVRPLYQKYSQDYIVCSDITVITNVREDHQEEMGETLEEIADSLALTIPRNGILITAEDRPHLRRRLAERAQERGSVVMFADPASVSDEDMRGFDYLQFKENVATGLAVAELAGVPRQVALTGMWKSVPDIGVVRIRTYDINGKKVTWIPLFAANDRESVVTTLHMLAARFTPDSAVVGILNNRRDRGRRAELFATMIPSDLPDYFDRLLLCGAYEDLVAQMLADGGFATDRIVKAGESVRPSLEQLLAAVTDGFPGEDVVLIGMVNIHTEQAEMLLEHFTTFDGPVLDSIAESRDPARLPNALTRFRQFAPTASSVDDGVKNR